MPSLYLVVCRLLVLGTDTGPNPAEYLLHAPLAACLTTSLVYVAAARGIQLTEVESLEGDMNMQGALGLSDEYRNGFETIRISFRVEGNAPEEKLREIVARAPSLSEVPVSYPREVAYSRNRQRGVADATVGPMFRRVHTSA